MDLRQLTMLALQASIIGTVFAFGLSTSVRDLEAVLHRPGLFARALLSVYIVMPVAVVLLVRLGDFRNDVEIVLMALALSPVPPLLPTREGQAGGNVAFGVGLMAFLALCSIVTIPFGLAVLERVFHRPLVIESGTIAGIALKTVLLPITVGVAARALFPELARRVAKPVRMVATVLLLLASLAVLAGAFRAVLAIFGQGNALAIVIFTVVGLAIGHFLGGPNPDEAAVVALSTACRHPAIALTIAATNNPEQHFGPIIVFYILVGAIVGIPYLIWSRRSTRALATTCP
jgi:BASS family bile acid:Na+ symporter